VQYHDPTVPFPLTAYTTSIALIIIIIIVIASSACMSNLTGRRL
jgi:hypothetical protein